MIQSTPETDTDQKQISFEEALADHPGTYFVGREKPLEQLRDHLQKAIEGSGGFVVISGEAGTGKTHLVKQFAAEGMASGATFVAESYQGVPSYEPYRPFWKIVQHFSPAQESASLQGLQAKNGASSSGNAYDMESLYSLQTDHRLAQQRLIKALLEVERDRVLIISLWDIHLAPLTAWQFIHFFSESLVDKRILFILTLRQDGREAHPEKIPVYADVLQRMNREGLIQRIQLERFSPKETRQLIRKILKRTDFSSHFVDTLHQVSAGLPERMIQLLQLMYEKEIIFQQKGVWFDREDTNRQTLIDILNQEEHLPYFDKVWNNLTPLQQAILEYGSLFEDVFDHLMLSAVLEKSRIRTVKEFVKLQQQKILFNVEDEKYHFKYPTVASRIKNQIPLSRQKEMHKKIADSIKGSSVIGAADKIPLLAYHFSRTEDVHEAFQYLREAGNWAMKNFAFVKARELFEQAMSSLDSLPEKNDTEQQIEILFKMIWLNRVLGNREDSLMYCVKTLEALRLEQPPNLKTQILIQKGLTYFQLNEWQNATECFKACFVDNPDESRFDQAMAHYGLGNVYLEMSEYDLAEKHYREALEFVKTFNENSLKANLFNNLGIVENIRGNRLRAINLYSNCIPIYKALGDNFGLARVYTNIGISYAHEKDWGQANDFYGKSLSVTDAMGLVPLKSVAFLNRVQALIALNKFDEAREYNVKAYRLLKRLKDKLGLAEYYKNQGILEREANELAEAKESFNKALQLFETLRNKLGSAETEYEMGLLELAGNNPQEMKAWFKRAKVNYHDLGLSEKVQEIDKQLDH